MTTKISRQVKPLAAGAAGVALLLAATGGTYALWADGDGAGFGGAQNTTGDLRLDHASSSLQDGGHVWQWQVNGTERGTGANLGGTVQAGDVITATTWVDATLAGATLVANLVADSSLTGGDTYLDDNPYLAITTSVTVGHNPAESGAPSHEAGQPYLIAGLTPASPNLTLIPVTVTITIPSNIPQLGAGSENQQPIDFGGFQLELIQQVSPTALPVG